MKIRAERKALAEVVTWVSQAISKNPPAPALAGMHLEAADGRLTLRGFDYDVSHQAHLDVDVVSDGHCLVSAAFLRGIVSALKGVSIELVLDGVLSLSCGSATYRTNVLKVDDYPSLPAQPPAVGTVDAATLAAAVAACRPSVEDDSPHPPLRGLHLEGDANRLVVVGLRRSSGVEATIDWAGSALEISAPIRSLDPAVKGMTGELAIGLQDGVLGVSDAHRSVTMRTYSEKFADWRKALRDPASDHFECVVDVDELIEVCKRAGALSDDTAPLVLTFDVDQIQVEISAGERGGGSEVVAAETSPDPAGARLAMAPRYFLEALGAMPSGLVRLGVGNTARGRIQAVMVRPHEGDGLVSMVQPKLLPEAYT